MLRIKESVNLKELEKFGFEKGVFTRTLEGKPLYQVVITKKHRYIQIRVFSCASIAKSLQELLYNLIQAGLVEKVEG